MQQLHLVGFTTDRQALIFSVRRGAKSGSYTVAVDDALFEVIEDAKAWLADAAGDQPLPPPPVDNRPQSQLSVREMQARLRRGMSVEEVAADAGVEPSWVARFAAPVLTERAEVIRAVRAARFERRNGISGAPLGEAVYRNLAVRGVLTPRDELDRAWSARQLVDGLWEVSFHYTYRQRQHHVRWGYDASTGKLTARDRLASALAFREGGSKATRSRNGRPGTSGRATSAIIHEATEEEAPAGPPKAVKKVAAARKAAAARLAAEVQKAAKRDAAIARAAAKRPPRPIPPRLPDPEPEPDVRPESVDPEPAPSAANGRPAAVVVRGEDDERAEPAVDAETEGWEPADSADEGVDSADGDPEGSELDAIEDADEAIDEAIEEDAAEDVDDEAVEDEAVDDEVDAAMGESDDWADEPWGDEAWDDDDTSEPQAGEDDASESAAAPARPLFVIDPERPRRREPLRARPATEDGAARRVVGERPTIRAQQAGGSPARRQLRAR